MKKIIAFLLLAGTAIATQRVEFRNQTDITLTGVYAMIAFGEEAEHGLYGPFTSEAHTTYGVDVAISGHEGDSYTINFYKPGGNYDIVGNSFVAIDSSQQTLLGQSTGSWIDGNLHRVSFGDSTPVPASTPDHSKTLWRVEDTTLTADLFREGVDKVVYAGALYRSSSTGGTSTTDMVNT